MDNETQNKSDRNEKDFNEIILCLWRENINRSVDPTDLSRTIAKLNNIGYSSDYLVFALKYIIGHKYKLNYPGGFEHYVAYDGIKEAYKKKQRKIIKMSDFVAVDTDDYPRYTYHIKHRRGFADLFGGGD